MESSTPPVTPVGGSAGKTNTLALLSLITGIVGFLGTCLGIIPVLGWPCAAGGGILGIAALVLGLIGLIQVRKNNEKGRGLAVAGLILGGLCLLGVIVYGLITALISPLIEDLFTQISNDLLVP